MSTQTFSYTGSDQTFVVPSGITAITVDCQGAEGGPNQATTVLGGKGGRVVCDLTVTPGETLHITVGQHPTNKSAGYPDGGAGGGTGIADAGGGAGSSDVRQGGTATANRVIIAGGGGGAGGNGTTNVGGSGAGGNGGNGALGSGTTAGVGATTSAGGAFGSGGGGGPNGTAGSLAQGGTGGNATRGGGGGGGGYYGGGGGGAGGSPGNEGSGGGGGSGLGTSVNQTLTSAFRSGNGQVIFTWTVQPRRLAQGTASGVSNFTSAAGAPGTNRLQMFSMTVNRNDSTAPTAPSSVTGCGLTWVLAKSNVFDLSGADQVGVFTYRALGTPTDVTVGTILGYTAHLVAYVWDELANVTTSGTNGSGAIVQSDSSGNVNTSPAGNLAAFGGSTNATYAAIGYEGSGVTLTAGSGFTLTGAVADAGTNCVVQAEFRSDNDTTPDATLGSSVGWGISSFEIAVSPASVQGTQATETDTANAGAIGLLTQGSMATSTTTANAGAALQGGVGSQANETDMANVGTSIKVDSSSTFPRLAPSFIPLRG